MKMKKISKLISLFLCICFLVVPLSTQVTAATIKNVQHTIYYPNGDWLYQPVIVSVPVKDSFMNALDMLVKGIDKPNNCYNEFPKNSTIENFEVMDNTATITFERSIANNVDNINYSYDVMQDIIAKNVFENYPNIENVVLKVDLKVVNSVNKQKLWNDTKPEKIQTVFGNKLESIINDIQKNVMSKEDAKKYIQDTLDKELATNNSAMSISSLLGKKICIDPGHGGSEYGATASRDGTTYYEKNFNLVIASSLKSYLEGLGMTCYMTRTTDTDVSLTSRYTLANNQNVDIFISTHCNSSSWTFIGGTTALWPANHDIDSSMSLAVQVNNSVYANTPFGLKEPYQDVRGLAVLNGTTMPAIITETGYMSYGADLTYLIPFNNRWDIGTYIGKGVEYFFN